MLLIREEGEASLRVVAEQIAWTKAKSERIGLRIPITDDAAALLQSEQVYGFDRHGDTWREWSDKPAGALASLLDYNSDEDAEGENHREASMLCAPLATRVSLVGVLKIAARYPEQLKPLDIRMPDLDGFELMAQLKARFPALDVILMTGSVDDLDEKLVRAIRSPAFYFIQKPFDREVLRTLVERCVELRWRREDHRQNLKRLETELAEARAFQQSLLPDRESTVNRVSICCRYTPCSALGGDLYDYADATAGQTALLIADVSGHGVSAAMLTGIVKSAFHASHVDGFEPIAVVQRVSIGLAAFRPDRFVTLVAALISPGDRRLRYVNAGHPPILLWGSTRKPLCLESTGPLVSPVLTASTWDAPVVSMDVGDHFLLYTDGVSETLADENGRAEERLTSAIDRASEGGAPLLDTILADVHHELAGRPQPDDLTLLTAVVRAYPVRGRNGPDGT